MKLRSYSGHEIPVVGEVKVQVSYGNRVACLPVIFTQLMGRNWLSILKLNWKQVKEISQELFGRIDNLTSKNAPLFDGSLGTIKGVTAHLKLKENTNPSSSHQDPFH